MAAMHTDKRISNVTSFLDQATKRLDPTMLEWLKQHFEANIGHLMGTNLRQLHITLVLDANIAIQTINNHAKDGKKSILHHLHNNPMFSICAPPDIIDEVNNYINDDNESGKYDRKKLKLAWNKLKKVITIKDVINKKILQKAFQLTQGRDPDDTPYVGLYIETGAAAVLTDDKDYEDFSVKTFNIEKLNDVVGTFHRGIYSFFIFNEALPFTLKLISEITLAIIKAMFDFFSLLFGIVKNIMAGAIEKLLDLFSRVPKNIQKTLGITLLIGGIITLIILIMRPDLRTKLTTKLRSAGAKVKGIIEKVLKWLNNAFKTVIEYSKSTGPYAKTSLVVLVEIHENIALISEEIKSLFDNPAHFA